MRNLRKNMKKRLLAAWIRKTDTIIVFKTEIQSEIENYLLYKYGLLEEKS